ncbi:MAG: hypothetical protein LBG29_06445 [Synergistaceae bacterium]|nr:hypothetical protein [Synergistaceae bacterium]
MIFIRARTWRSLVMRAADGDFSHAGIVRLVNGLPCVIHAEPASKAVKMAPAADFFSGADRAAAYRPRGCRTAEAASREAMGYFERQTPFDSQFDISDGGRLYCTELVWRAYKHAGLDLGGGSADFLSAVPLYGKVLLPSRLSESACLEKVADTAGLGKEKFE